MVGAAPSTSPHQPASGCRVVLSLATWYAVLVAANPGFWLSFAIAAILSVDVFRDATARGNGRRGRSYRRRDESRKESRVCASDLQIHPRQHFADCGTLKKKPRPQANTPTGSVSVSLDFLFLLSSHNVWLKPYSTAQLQQSNRLFQVACANLAFFLSSLQQNKQSRFGMSMTQESLGNKKWQNPHFADAVFICV